MEFWARSIFGVMTGEPFVQVDFAGERVQCSPAEARKMASILLESAEAAESDACVVHCLTDMGMSRDHAARFLMALRQKREELNGTDDAAPTV